MKTKVIIGISLALSVAALILGYNAGHKRGFRKGQREFPESQIIKTEEHTIKVEPIVFTRVEEKLVYFRDTIRIPVPQTDTVFISVPREYKVYEDSLYRAVVSGYSPRLDSLTVYQTQLTKTITITNKQKPSRWGIGLYVGYGFSVYQGKFMRLPQAGIGVNYDLF